MDSRRGTFRVSSDFAAVDIDAVHAFLTASYWAHGISREVVARSIAGSLPFSLFDGDAQVGFGRVVTDRATFGYLADIYVLDRYRGHGLGTWLVECIMAHPELRGLRRLGLVTQDAHRLYAKFGFTSLAVPECHMEIHRPRLYQQRP